MSDLTTKRCSKCGKEYPATKEYFYQRGGDRLRPDCKTCTNVNSKEQRTRWKENNIEWVRERSRLYHLENKEREAQYSKEWREKNADHIKAHYINNREAILKRQKENYLSDKMPFLIRSKHYRENNKERVRQWQREWEERNKEYVKERRHQYYLSHKRQHSQRKRVYRHLKRANCGKMTSEQIQELLEWQNYRCMYCGTDISNDSTIDHHIAVSQGGSNDITNLVMACRSCNSSKGNKNPFQWYKMREYL